MMTFEQMKDIQQAFVQEYMLPAQWQRYVNMCSISTMKNNLCLEVRLLKPLPPGMSIPLKYRGIKVFVRVTGEIKPL